MTREELIAAIEAGDRPSYLLFWGHRDGAAGIGKACLSQWYPAVLDLDGARYPTAEHWMMASKARLFGDARTASAILEAPTPAEAKRLGREVRGFDEVLWRESRMDIVVRGNVAKFGQHAGLRSFLLGTADQVLVEASPVDRVWGIGLAASDDGARDPRRWRGANLLGFALMRVRDELRRSS